MAKLNIVNYDIDFSTLIPASAKNMFRIMRPDEIVLSYGEYNKEKKRCKRLKIRIGNEILKHLKWTFKDKLQLFNFPDDLRKVVVVKKDSGCAAISASVRHPYWQFTIINELKFMRSPPFEIDYEIHKLGYLVFRLEDPVIA